MADDNLKTALTGAGVGAIVLEFIRRAADAWQKREQHRSEEKQRASLQSADATLELRRHLEGQIVELRREIRRLSEDLDDQERRSEDSERRSVQVREGMLEFLTVVAVLLPEIPDPVQRRLQSALERLRQVSGLG